MGLSNYINSIHQIQCCHDQLKGLLLQRKKRFDKISDHLLEISLHVQTMINRLENLEKPKYHSHDLVDYEKQRSPTIEKYKQTIKLFRQATESLEEKQISNQFDQKKGFDSSLDSLQQLTKIYSMSQESFQEDKKLITQMNSFIQLGIENCFQANQSTYDFFRKAIQQQENINYLQGCDFYKMQREWKLFIKLNDNIEQIHNLIIAKVAEAEQLLQTSLSTTELVISATAGGSVGMAIAGPIGGVIGASMVPIGLIGGKKIYYQADPSIEADLFSFSDFKRGERIYFKFDSTSSGYSRYWSSTCSKTVGNLYLKVNKFTILKIRFNLNQSEFINYQQLYDRLLASIKEGELAPEHCLQILARLKEISIYRGEGGQKITGFIEPASPYFDMLIEQCNHLISTKGSVYVNSQYGFSTSKMD